MQAYKISSMNMVGSLFFFQSWPNILCIQNVQVSLAGIFQFGLCLPHHTFKIKLVEVFGISG